MLDKNNKIDVTQTKLDKFFMVLKWITINKVLFVIGKQLKGPLKVPVPSERW